MSILTARKLKWHAPEYWSGKFVRIQDGIYNTFLSTRLEKLNITYDAVEGELKGMKLVHLCYSCREDIIE